MSDFRPIENSILSEQKYDPFSPEFKCRVCGLNFERTKKNEGEYDVCHLCNHEEEG